jgi:hypothetical protein
VGAFHFAQKGKPLRRVVFFIHNAFTAMLQWPRYQYSNPYIALLKCVHFDSQKTHMHMLMCASAAATANMLALSNAASAATLFVYVNGCSIEYKVLLKLFTKAPVPKIAAHRMCRCASLCVSLSFHVSIVNVHKASARYLQQERGLLLLVVSSSSSSGRGVAVAVVYIYKLQHLKLLQRA